MLLQEAVNSSLVVNNPADPMETASKECALGRGQEFRQTKQVILFSVFSS